MVSIGYVVIGQVPLAVQFQALKSLYCFAWRSSLFFEDNGYYKDILIASILFAVGITAIIAVILALQGNTVCL